MTATPHNTTATILSAILVTIIGCDDGWHDVTLPTTPNSNESRQELTEPTTDETADTLVGKAVAITDGDTFKLLVDNEEIRVRLEGIDCPEKRGGQPYCNRAKQALSELIFGRQVSVKSIGTDR